MVRVLRAVVGFVAGFAVGSAFGYAATTLLTPYEGQQARYRLLRDSATLRALPRERVDSLQARIQYAVDEGRRAAAETRAEIEAQTGVVDTSAAPDASGGAPADPS
jgi:hypothetical protein